MASNFGVTMVAGTGVIVVFVDTVAKGNDPFPSLVAGGFYIVLVTFVAMADKDLALAVAWLFLLSQLLTKSSTVLNVITGFTTGSTPTAVDPAKVKGSATTNGGYKVFSPNHPTNQLA